MKATTETKDVVVEQSMEIEKEKDHDHEPRQYLPDPRNEIDQPSYYVANMGKFFHIYFNIH